MSSLSGKVCLVTGASSGIGRRTAIHLAEAGATVCAAARRRDRLEELMASLPGAGHSYQVTDVSDREQVRALAGHVEGVHGALHVLVNNAGFSGRERFAGPEAIAEVERVMATNFFGAVYCTGELLGLLERSAPSGVVNVASVAGRIAAPGVSAYCASKFALVGWTEALQPELARRGIHMSSIEPGFIPTEGFPHHGLRADRLMRHILGTEEDVARAIVDAIVNRKVQRVVPRFYYLLQVPKVLAPRLFRYAYSKVRESGAARDYRT